MVKRLTTTLYTMQYRGNSSQLLVAKVRQISGAQITFRARKFKTCLPSLKTSFARELRFKVVYKLVHVVDITPPMSARQSEI